MLQRLSAEASIVSPSGEKKPRARVLPWAILCGGIALAAYAIWPRPPVPETPKEVIVVKEVPVKDPETERQLLEEKQKREEAERKLAESQKPTPPAATPAPTPAAMPVRRAEPVSPLDDGTIGKPIQLKLPGSVIMKLCYCPPGSFTMGSPASEADRSDDEDQVQVRLSQGFWMGQTEVTQAQWQALMGSNPSNFKGDDLPVEMVSWEDAQAYITKLNATISLSGWRLALPTEAQWEYACRAGTKTPFAFGSTLTSAQANFDGNYPYGTPSTGKYLEKTSSVGSYTANAWGLYDMHGNVWEWCEDRWDGTAKLTGGTDPLSAVGSYRVFRGGSWVNLGRICRSAYRNGYDPGLRLNYLGFRLAAVPVGQR
ncbi:MAG: formylglycine-generating enzyme family protein [Roseimicrobium sp.]